MPLKPARSGRREERPREGVYRNFRTPVVYYNYDRYWIMNS